MVFFSLMLQPTKNSNYHKQFLPNTIRRGKERSMRQPASPLSFEITLTIAYVIIFLVALFGNTLIIFLVVKYPELKTTFNRFIVNMAVSDLLIAINAIPLSLVPGSQVVLRRIWCMSMHVPVIPCLPFYWCICPDTDR